MTIGDGLGALAVAFMVVGVCWAMAWGDRGQAESEARKAEARMTRDGGAGG